MASAAAMNTKLEEIARSVLPATTTPSRSRRLIEHFSRAVKHHNFARTNQFEVQERLIGLEEKFQVLDHDDLSDALRERRLELNDHQDRWIPDALHLLLNLSQDSLGGDRLEKLAALNRDVAVVPVLKWSDIEGDEPINPRDRLWRQPKFEDSSSDDDDADVSTTDTSPACQKHSKSNYEGLRAEAFLAQQPDRALLERFREARLSTTHGATKTITEIQLIKEVLYMVQGFPTPLFSSGTSFVQFNSSYRLAHYSESSLKSALAPVISIARSVKSIKMWLKAEQDIAMMQVIHDSIQELMHRFDIAVNDHQSRLASQSGGVISLLQAVDSIERSARTLLVVVKYLDAVQEADQISCLDSLYDTVCYHQVCGDSTVFQDFIRILQASLTSYVKPISRWTNEGVLLPDDDIFFIQRSSEAQLKSMLWHNWYQLLSSGSRRLPKFLTRHAQLVFSVGKTQSFLQNLTRTTVSPDQSLVQYINDVFTLVAKETLLPFSLALNVAFETYLSTISRASTAQLQASLHNKLGLDASLSALSRLFLGENGLMTDNIDSVIFSKLDKRDPSWNDRFIISDIYEEIFATVSDIRLESIIVHSQPTPTSSLKNDHHSVTLLCNLSIDYLLPWPVANIIQPTTIASYQRISLILQQIRRARWMLERHALLALQARSTALLSRSVSVVDGKLLRPVRQAEGVYLILHTFVVALYTHLTTVVIAPLTSKFRANIGDKEIGIDDMISIHATYLHTIEIACLTANATKIKMLHDTTIEILDLCLRFASILTGKSAAKEYNLGDLLKIKTQARRSIDLLIAGILGIVRGPEANSKHENRQGITAASSAGRGHRDHANGEAKIMLEMIADKLESCSFR